MFISLLLHRLSSITSGAWPSGLRPNFPTMVSVDPSVKTFVKSIMSPLKIRIEGIVSEKVRRRIVIFNAKTKKYLLGNFVFNLKTY